MSNTLKRTFVMVGPTINAALGGYAITMIATGAEATLAWVGLAVAASPFPLFFTVLLLTKALARTGKHALPLSVTSLVGLGLAVGGGLAAGASQSTLAVTILGAFVSLAMSLIYIYWYSVLGRRPSEGLVVGAPLPDLEFLDQEGAQVTTRSLRGKKALMLFFRGNWCPLCMAQIKEIAGMYRQLDERGVRVVLVSPQPAGHSASLASRFEAPMTFLIDKDHKAARALGINHTGGLPLGMEALGYEGETVLPTAVILDDQGVVLWADQTDNYRVRPEPETFLRVLDGIEGLKPPAP